MKDKIIYWLDANLFGFSLPYYIQQKLEHESYAIIDITNKPKTFFDQQKFVEFKKNWYLHDNIDLNDKKIDIQYLSSFEKKYRINLWSIAINERIFHRFNRLYNFSDDEILLILQQECQLFEKILDEIKPDFFVTTEPALHHHELFYELCRAKGIKVLMMSIPNIANKILISEQTKKFDHMENYESTPSQNRNFEQLQKYLEEKKMSKQLTSYRSGFKTSKIFRLKSSINYLLMSNNSNIKTHYTYFGRTKLRVLCDALKMSLNARKRKSFIDKFLKHDIHTNEKFVYYPLGVDEERNQLISTPFYTNQIELIRNIAKSLPIDYKLYVKETPDESVRYWRSISEYKQILSIPNVKLFHPASNTKQFLKNCSLVISTGGTSGFEAAFFAKPSIVIADLAYTILPSVFRMDSLEQLRKMIKQSLETSVESIDLDRYLLFLEKNTIDFNPLEIVKNYQQLFYFGGNLVDVTIESNKMKKFLQDNSSLFESLINEFIKKINDHKIGSS